MARTITPTETRKPPPSGPLPLYSPPHHQHPLPPKGRGGGGALYHRAKVSSLSHIPSSALSKTWLDG